MKKRKRTRSTSPTGRASARLFRRRRFARSMVAAGFMGHLRPLPLAWSDDSGPHLPRGSDELRLALVIETTQEVFQDLGGDGCVGYCL